MFLWLFKKFLLKHIDTISKNLNLTTLIKITPIQLKELIRKTAMIQSFMSWWAHIRWILLRFAQIWSFIIRMICRHSIEYRILRNFLLDHLFLDQIELKWMSSRSKRILSRLVDKLWVLQKLNMKTHLVVRQREDFRGDLTERMKCVPPDLRIGESVLCWREDSSKIQQGRTSGKWLKVEIIAVKGSMMEIHGQLQRISHRKILFTYSSGKPVHDQWAWGFIL